MTHMFRLLILILFFVLTGCATVLSTGGESLEHDPGKRSVGARMDDETIEIRAAVNIAAADQALKGSHITAVSFNGYVLIVGQVPSQALKDKVSEIVKEVRDVRRIYNELEVAGNNSLMVRSSDAWITTKVKSSLLANSDTEGNRVKVITENSVVYLMGLATRAEGDRIEETASATQGVERVVSVFEYID